MTQNIDQCVLKTQAWEEILTSLTTHRKTREILSPNEILKHRNVYSLPETNILFVEVTEFKGTYSQDIVTTIADKAPG